eukprot:TRINITY_DN11017_c0_g1_i5.p1 TRINITY_DN11017_c0_g1~~TRINITY_DN11017_c0_g1_i5.p1  ORF type:complete len:714 (+),score=254.53 TRINITY_DN11017_c0_g1_i5:76-2217(+)
MAYQTKLFKLTLVSLAMFLAPGRALKSTNQLSVNSLSMGNPIRKVIGLLEKMSTKIEEEAKQETELYEKFECYCKKTQASLEDFIKTATESPVTQADIDAKKAKIAELNQALKKIKADKAEEENTLQTAETRRSTDHYDYTNLTHEQNDDIAVMDEVLTSLNGSDASAASTASFLQQKESVSRLVQAVRHNTISPFDRERLMSLLSSADQSGSNPGIGQVVGIIKETEDRTKNLITEEDSTEDQQVKTFKEVEASKETSILALLEHFERKLKTVGELKVEIVQMEQRMKEEGSSLQDSQKMLDGLKASCAKKAKDWDARKVARQTELVGLQDTIKILSDDKSLDIFRKRATSLIQMPAQKEDTIKILSDDKSLDIFRKRATSLIQMPAQKEAVKKAISFVEAAKSKDSSSRPELSFLALALSGKKVDFSKVIKKIDSLIDLMEKEQKDDDAKKEYCETEFRKNAATTKDLKAQAKLIAASVDEKTAAIEQLDKSIKALQDSVQDLDKDVAQAGENRKMEHEEYQSSLADDSTAVDLLVMARERLYKVYHPEFTTTTTSKSPYDLSLQQISGSLEQPPPTFSGEYKKNTESSGVLKMIGTLMNEIDKEMAVAKVEEEDAQVEYEKTVEEAAKKREDDLALASEKANDKAEMEGDLQDDKSQVKSTNDQILAASKVLADLHTQCDWNLKTFDVRKEARTEERENLIRSKTVLGNM